MSDFWMDVNNWIAEQVGFEEFKNIRLVWPRKADAIKEKLSNTATETPAVPQSNSDASQSN